MTRATAGKRIRVALVFGGMSSEHDVSCLTAGGVSRAIDHDRFEVVGIGITPSGRWVQVATPDIQGLDVVDGVLPRLDENRPDAVIVADKGIGQVATRTGNQLEDIRNFDVAFSLLHGPFGEDGTIQGLFEMLGVRYVGSGVAASAIGMDKDLMKRAMAQAGLPVGPWVAFTPRRWEWAREAVLRDIAKLTMPLYVKPARGGSSMGISRITRIDDLPAAVAEAQQYDPKIMVEQGFVDVREIEVAVLGGLAGGAPRVSLAGEIIMHTDDAFYDFRAKYTPEEQVSLKVPADVTPDVLTAVQHVAADTFEAMGAEGLARVDLFVTKDRRVFVNEINTMPGFTRLSMFPMMWDATGLSYPDLIADLIEQAMVRPMGLR